MRISLPPTPRDHPSSRSSAASYGLTGGHPGGYYAGGSSGSTYPGYARAAGDEFPVCEAQCQALQAVCCRKPPLSRAPHELAAMGGSYDYPSTMPAVGPRWNYVGHSGWGGYDKVMRADYASEGRGSYDDPDVSKKRSVCIAVVSFLAVLAGTCIMLTRCMNGDDMPWCHTEVEESMEDVARSAWAQVTSRNPEEYCRKGDTEKGKMDYCCKISRELCRAFMTAQMGTGEARTFADVALVDDSDRKWDDIPHGRSQASATAVRVTASTGSPTTPPPKLPHDCITDFSEWQTKWSTARKEWCCDHALRGCSDGPASFAESREQGIFDCAQGFEEEWTVPKQAWCCVHATKGCPK